MLKLFQTLANESRCNLAQQMSHKRRFDFILFTRSRDFKIYKV